MGRLAQRDIEAFLSHLREIYAYSDLEDFASQIISALPRILPSETVSYAEMDVHSHKVGVELIDPPALNHAQEDELFHRYIHEHPFLDHYKQTGEGRAVKISDFLTRTQWQNRALYNEFYKELRGTEHQMAVGIPTSTFPVAITLGRSGRDFSERDRSVLDLLRPHLVQAHRNAAALMETRRDANRLRRVVDGVERGMIVLSGGNRMQWCNEHASRWLQEYFEPARGVDRLPESLNRWVEHQKLLLSAGNAIPPPREPLILKRPGKRLQVRFVSNDTEGETRLLVLEERHASLSTDSLQSLGFTPREAEVLIHVAQGKSNSEIAAILFVSPRTVKKHLDNVYSKSNVTSRTEALSHALRALGILG